MPTTLRDLVAHEPLGLVPVAPTDAAPGVLDAPVTWVHSSDLVDPTPWLEPGHLLLTDGTQFASDAPADEAGAYVARLQAAGVAALGFAIDIAHPAVPAALAAACGARAFPLLEVRGRTPFIAIVRHVAERSAAEQRARLEWSQAAQRAIARAALRTDGLGAILRELERRLDSWVQLYDAAGELVEIPTRVAVPAELAPEVASAARDALRRGSPAAARLQLGPVGATLQTLGRARHLRGVLVVGTDAPLDAAGNDLVSSVIALASIALEQGRALEDARRDVRLSALELLLHGDAATAAKVVAGLGIRLPAGALRVAVVGADEGARPFVEALERLSGRRPHRLFFAERDDDVVLLLAAEAADAVTSLVEERGLSGGLSSPVLGSDLARGLAEATRASRCRRTAPAPSTADAGSAAPAARGVGRLVRFESLAEEGLIGVLTAAGGDDVARHLLAPALDPASADGRELLRSAAVWLACNGAWDPAARRLGIHRHTLRGRVDALARLLGLDLVDDFGDRVELWSALRLLDLDAEV